MRADYIQHCGDDLTVVNAAKVSFDKESSWDPTLFTEGDLATQHLSEKDVKLVRYLSKHGHWTPFSHPQITFRMTAPIFVARQAFKHKVGFTENEISRRYVDDAPEFFMPETWRGKPINAKQGSSEEVIERFAAHQMEYANGLLDGREISGVVESHFDMMATLYQGLLDSGVAPEQARMVLPQAMYTSWYWTASLASWARFYRQRTDSHAQSEIRDLAKMVGPTMEALFPVCWKELTNGQPS